mgnify:CR=1 FL=1
MDFVEIDENAKKRVMASRCGHHALGAGQNQKPEFCDSAEIVLRVFLLDSNSFISGGNPVSGLI